MDLAPISEAKALDVSESGQLNILLDNTKEYPMPNSRSGAQILFALVKVEDEEE